MNEKAKGTVPTITKTSTSQFSKYLGIFCKTILFNLFALGFILNLVTFTSIDWIVGEHYVIGILKYCKGSEFYGSRRLVFYNSRLVHQSAINELKCFYWNEYNKPKFLRVSFMLQLVGITLHCVTILFIVLTVMFSSQKSTRGMYEKLFRTYARTSKKRLEIYFFRFGLFHRDALVYIIGSGLGFLISTAYCSNILIFWMNNVLGRYHGKREDFSWCFWVSLVGFCASLFSTCVLFVHTIKNKMLRIDTMSDDVTFDLTLSKTGFQQPTQYNEAFTLTRRTSINPLLLTNRSSSPSQYNKFKRSVKIKRLWRHSIKQLLQKSRADLRNLKTVDLEEYFQAGVVPKSPTVAVAAATSAAVIGQCVSLNLEEAVLRPAQMYSQVYPVNKNKKNLKHTKMTALPFGSLSGVLMKNSISLKT